MTAALQNLYRTRRLASSLSPGASLSRRHLLRLASALLAPPTPLRVRGAWERGPKELSGSVAMQEAGYVTPPISAEVVCSSSYATTR